jgi:hypothetical protein
MMCGCIRVVDGCGYGPEAVEVAVPWNPEEPLDTKDVFGALLVEAAKKLPFMACVV